MEEGVALKVSKKINKCIVLGKMQNRRLLAMVRRRICSWEESSSVGSSAPQERSEDVRGTF